MPTREAIVAAASGWLGTPYHHQAATELPIILGGLGLAALGAKVDDAAAKPGTRQPARSK